MFARVYTASIWGIEGVPVTVEADSSDGLPGFEMVGYLGSEVREAGTRVRSALLNSGFHIPPCRLTVSLSPADLRKQGNFFDLPVAIAILEACGYLNREQTGDWLYFGELALDGTLKPVNGTLALAGCAVDQGLVKVFLPKENEREASCDTRIRAKGVESLREAVWLLHHPEEIVFADPGEAGDEETQEADFRDVRGQLALRRATEVAAAGMHNILYIGPAGSGKTMVARRIPGILPPMTVREQLEVSKIYSICGLLAAGKGLMKQRPFRSPHHTISQQALAGGGYIPKPGEVSLADRGVLFLDELPEFKKYALEVLRQPIEDRKVLISRVNGSFTYPTRFMLAAAMNPCPCGFYPDRSRCRCTRGEVERYLNRISQPLLDRIDLCVEAPPLSYRELTQEEEGEDSASIRARVCRAMEIQKERYAGDGILFNSELTGSLLRKYCVLGEKEEKMMEQVFLRMGLSARAHDRIRKVARTIADLEGEEHIGEKHIAEAVSYRAIDKKYWGS